MLDFLIVCKKSWFRRNFAMKKKYNKRIPCEKVENNFNNKINNEKSTYIVDLDYMQEFEI
jgi:hypothetical protein